MAAHAKLGGSSAKRWRTCPGSPRMIASLPPEERDRPSSYAREGNAAHALGEVCLNRGGDAADYIGSWAREGSRGDWHIRPAATDPAADIEVTEEMAEAVQVYLDTVRSLVNERPGCELHVELGVQPLPDRSDLWGTADAVIHDELGGELIVIDYKHGAGVPVEVEGNDQLRYYALGAYHRVRGGAGEVTLVVVQPRAQHADGPVRMEVLSELDLLMWGEDLEADVQATEREDAPLVAGDHCRATFCPAQATCPAVRALVQESAALDFADPPADAKGLYLPDPEDPVQVAQALNVVDLISAWCREVQGFAMRRLEAGREVPGYKLVRKRSQRRWRDAEDVEKKLRNKRGVTREDMYEIKLKGPAKLEKVKAIGKDWVGKYAEKPEGDLTIAPESDSRPAAPAPAIADFAGSPLPDEGGEDDFLA